MAIGDFYFQRKETDQALGDYRRGLSVSPKNMAILKRLQGRVPDNQPEPKWLPTWIKN